MIHDLQALPEKVEKALMLDGAIEEAARIFMGARDFLFLGRGNQYPIALEGALKLKEI
jgi:glucosamine--fructose-6-phosphate aminotransferase (isomerizing)